MLEGWYCRTLANQQAAQQDGTPNDPNNTNLDEESDDSQEQQDAQGAGGNNTVDYKTQYRYLKRKLKFIIYENEFFQDALRSNQRRLLKVSRDRAFLLDRLLQYEKPENTSSESDETESSDDEATKKRKLEQSANGSARGRKRKNVAHSQPPTENVTTAANETQAASAVPAAAETTFQAQPPPAQELLEQHQPGHMTSAEVERHLQSRQSVMELIPERASATVPTEMFSNEPSLDSESNDHLIDGSSPTHVAAEECVAMEYTT